MLEKIKAALRHLKEQAEAFFASVGSSMAGDVSKAEHTMMEHLAAGYEELHERVEVLEGKPRAQVPASPYGSTFTSALMPPAAAIVAAAAAAPAPAPAAPAAPIESAPLPIAETPAAAPAAPVPESGAANVSEAAPAVAADAAAPAVDAAAPAATAGTVDVHETPAE